MGILIGSTTKLGSGLNEILGIRNLNWNSTLPVAIIGVVGTLYMVITTKVGCTSLA
jgi:hypothetical protein